MHSQAATYHQRFPRSIWNQLTAIDLRLLDQLAFLSRLTARRSPTGAKYCFPGRAWLAKSLDCSVETITRHTSKLARLGLLQKLQRRPVSGQWQTCLYRLVHPIAWRAAQVRHLIRSVSNRLSEVTAIGASAKPVNDLPRQKVGADPPDYTAWAARIAAKRPR